MVSSREVRRWSSPSSQQVAATSSKAPSSRAPTTSSSVRSAARASKHGFDSSNSALARASAAESATQRALRRGGELRCAPRRLPRPDRDASRRQARLCEPGRVGRVRRAFGGGVPRTSGSRLRPSRRPCGRGGALASRRDDGIPCAAPRGALPAVGRIARVRRGLFVRDPVGGRIDDPHRGPRRDSAEGARVPATACRKARDDRHDDARNRARAPKSPRVHALQSRGSRGCGCRSSEAAFRKTSSRGSSSVSTRSAGVPNA